MQLYWPYLDAFGVVYKINNQSALVKLKNAQGHLLGTRK